MPERHARHRGGRRSKVWRRRLLVWGSWGLVLLIGLAALFVWDTARSYEEAIRFFELQVGPANPARYAGPEVPAEENFVTAMSAAVEGVALEGGWTNAPEPAAWTAAEAVEARAALEREMPAILDLERGLALPHCVWPGSPVDPAVGSSAHTSSRLLRLMGFVGVLDGDRDLVERSFAGLGRLSDCLYSQPHLLNVVMATAVSRARLELVRAAVANPGTEPTLLDEFTLGLERFLGAGHVERVIAAEGAFALHFLEHPEEAGGQPRRGFLARVFGPVFARRVATQLARRWVGLRAWSERPLEELLVDPEPAPVRPLAFSGIVADMVMPMIRRGVAEMRTLEAQARLGLLAIEARKEAFAAGRYEDVLADRADLTALREGDGALVILDSELESLLREQEGTEAQLELTVWRLPSPARLSN